MCVFYIIFYLAVTTVMARPEPPLYMGLLQQNQRALSLNAHAAKPYIYQQLPHEHSFANFVTSVGTSADLPPPDTLAPATTETGLANVPQEDTYNAAYRYSSTQQYETGYENGPIETQVHKHIYLHVPPKDFEEGNSVQPRIKHQGGPKQKHYKIVFIKTPAAPTLGAPIVPPAPQNEEKTLIYVLHKKPEVLTDIVIPTPAPTKPSKPEVYFVKYKTRKEEASVYGPPLATTTGKILPRQASEESANDNNDFVPMDLKPYEIVATTQEPAFAEEEHSQQHQNPPQLISKEQASVGDPELLSGQTMTNFVNEKAQSIVAEPLNQYLPPETTLAPIVVDDNEEHVQTPSVTYGSPNRNRFFIKKRK